MSNPHTCGIRAYKHYIADAILVHGEKTGKNMPYMVVVSLLRSSLSYTYDYTRFPYGHRVLTVVTPISWAW